MRLAFIEGETLLGIGTKTDAFSVHYLCPDCGKVWAKEIIIDEPSQHTAMIVMCPKHYQGQPSRIPPIFADETNDGRFSVRTIPAEVWKRDFLYLLNFYGDASA